jgi:hypothetical protein
MVTTMSTCIFGWEQKNSCLLWYVYICIYMYICVRACVHVYVHVRVCVGRWVYYTYIDLMPILRKNKWHYFQRGVNLKAMDVQCKRGKATTSFNPDTNFRRRRFISFSSRRCKERKQNQTKKKKKRNPSCTRIQNRLLFTDPGGGGSHPHTFGSQPGCPPRH